MKAYDSNGNLKVTTGGGGGGSVTSSQFQALSNKVSTLSQNVSVISNALSVETINRISADNALSAAINVVSNANSALAGVVATNSAQMTSADNAISAAVNVVSNAVSILSGVVVTNSAQMTSADNALSAAINVVSNAASNALSVANAVSNRLSTWTLDNLANVSAPAPVTGQVLAFNSVAGQWVASTIVAGAGSVTSTELSAVSAAAASADATLSTRIDSVNTVVSNHTSAIAANSAQMTSADNALSAAINVVSNAASNALSVGNAVSNRLSTWTLDNLLNVSAPSPTTGQALLFNSTQNQWVASTIVAGTGSVTSTELSAVSAAAASAAATLSARIDSAMTVVSNQGSAIVANSAQMTSADNAISAAAAAVSIRVDSVMTVVSNQGSAIVANSAQMTSADNALSAAINVVSNAASNALSVGNAVSNRLSTWTLDNLAGVSAPSPTTGQALVFNSVAGQWVASTPPGGSGSVTSTELSAVSAAAASADATLSARIDSAMTVVSNQGSAIVANSVQMTSADNAISANVASVAQVVSTWATSGVLQALPIKHVLADAQVVSATAPVSLSGFTFTVSAAVAYQVKMGLMISSPISLAGPKLVLSVPGTPATMAVAYQYFASPGNSVANVAATNATVAFITISAVGAARMMIIEGAFIASANGTVALAVGNNVSGGAAGSSITFMAGSYGYVWRMT